MTPDFISESSLWGPLYALGVFAVLILVAAITQAVFQLVLRRRTRSAPDALDTQIVSTVRGPAVLFVVLLGLFLGFLALTSLASPAFDVLEGWDEIRQSWANIFRNTKRMQVRVSQLSVQVVGDLAWACCVEDITYASEGGFGTALVGATNIFLRLNGRWLMVQHHASQLPSSEDSKFPVQ